MKKCIVSLATVLLIALGATSAPAVPLWPADGAWQPIYAGSGYYIDPLYAGLGSDRYATPPQPEQTDLVGGIDSNLNGPFPTAYYYSDGTNLMFRMRVDNDPSQGPQGSQHVWTVFLNTNANLAVDWALQLDNKVEAQVELVPAVSGGPQNAAPWNPVVLADPPHAGVSPLSDWSRFVNATVIDGSQFHATGPVDDDFFVDLAFPWSTFQSMTGVGPSDSFQVAFATSTDHININKDLPDIVGWSNPVPEPATIWLLGAGMALLAAGRLAQRARQRSKSPPRAS